MSEMRVEIVAYDPTWPERFAAERAEVERLLAPWLVAPVEHVGSTSVPGLASKAVVDMLAPVTNLAASAPCIDPLSAAGWCYAPYRGDIEHWFCKPSPAFRTHHLHVMARAAQDAQDMLAFRDALRADDDLRVRYEALKRRLAADHPDDREAYTEAKSDFVAAALAATARPS
jgi:GrpB-like predicted nucleotidyltransferase (UPF0157 family)